MIQIINWFNQQAKEEIKKEFIEVSKTIHNNSTELFQLIKIQNQFFNNWIIQKSQIENIESELAKVFVHKLFAIQQDFLGTGKKEKKTTKKTISWKEIILLPHTPNEYIELWTTILKENNKDIIQSMREELDIDILAPRFRETLEYNTRYNVLYTDPNTKEKQYLNLLVESLTRKKSKSLSLDWLIISPLEKRKMNYLYEIAYTRYYNDQDDKIIINETKINTFKDNDIKLRNQIGLLSFEYGHQDIYNQALVHRIKL